METNCVYSLQAQSLYLLGAVVVPVDVVHSAKIDFDQHTMLVTLFKNICCVLESIHQRKCF